LTAGPRWRRNSTAHRASRTEPFRAGNAARPSLPIRWRIHDAHPFLGRDCQRPRLPLSAEQPALRRLLDPGHGPALRRGDRRPGARRGGDGKGGAVAPRAEAVAGLGRLEPADGGRVRDLGQAAQRPDGASARGRRHAGSSQGLSAAAGLGQPAHAVRGQRVHRFLRRQESRLQRRHHVPRPRERAAAELAAHADRLQRPGLVGGGLGHAGAPALGATEEPRARGAGLPALAPLRPGTGTGRGGRPARPRGR